jgi:hypothetical protein
MCANALKAPRFQIAPFGRTIREDQGPTAGSVEAQGILWGIGLSSAKGTGFDRLDGFQGGLSTACPHFAIEPLDNETVLRVRAAVRRFLPKASRMCAVRYSPGRTIDAVIGSPVRSGEFAN